ncbi:MAG: hypothetical protein ACO3LE_09440 [Bdellovibrionota bacterium]
MSEIIQREVEATLKRFRDGIFSAIKEDHPDIDEEEYDLQMEKFAKNTVKKIFATKEFKEVGKKMTKTKKEKRDPDAPKAAKNAFIFFCGENREKVKNEDTKLKPTEITKKLGEMWRELDDEDKEEYQNKAKEDKERFDGEMEDYEPKDGFRCPKKSPKKDKTTPKRARSAYIFFCGENREEVTKKLVKDGKEKKEVLAVLGKMWRELDDDEKKPYDKMAKKDKKRYETEMKNFEPESESDDEEEKPKEKPKKEKKSKSKSKSSDDEESESEEKQEKKSKKSKKSSDDEESESEEKQEKKPKKSKKSDEKPKKSKKQEDPEEELLSE